MEIETERLKFTELSLLDVSRQAEIAEEMAMQNMKIKKNTPF